MLRMKQHLFVLTCLLCACAGDDSGATPDGDPGSQPVDIVISGQAAKVEGTGLYPLEFLRIDAYLSSDEVTPIADTTTDMLGNFSITIHAMSDKPFDGYLRARQMGFMDTYLYAPDVLATDFAGASLRMVEQGTFDLLDSVCSGSQVPTNGFVAVKVMDEANAGVAGATVASSPAANKYCYSDAGGFPVGTQLSTSTDGSAFLFNVTGPVMLSAMKTGETFESRTVTARAGAVTMVMLQ
jgi:hypothetical protein